MLPSSCPEILTQFSDRVLTLLFNRQEYKNAITRDMYTALAEQLTAANDMPEVRVIVLKGAGGNFTSGNDLVDFMQAPEITPEHPVVRFMNALRYCKKPVIAHVQGHAVGIGTTMLLHCDLVYVAEDARLQMPFANLGLSPEYASSYLLPRLMGHPKAAALLLLGEPFSGSDAARWGIATDAIAQRELDDHVQARVWRLAQQAPDAIRRTKALLNAPLNSIIDKTLDQEFTLFSQGLAGDECKEAILAFFEKRPADFSRFQ